MDWYFERVRQSYGLHNIYDPKRDVYYSCQCKNLEPHIKEHLEGTRRLGIRWIDRNDYVTAVLIDVDAHDEISYEILSEKRELCIAAVRKIFPNAKIYESKRGGLHIYVFCYVPLEMGRDLAQSLKQLIQTRIQIHVDAFPTEYKPFSLEYFGKIDNELFPTEFRWYHKNEIEQALLSLPKPKHKDADLTRSGYDMRYLSRLLRSAPWNEGKRLTDGYIKHTLSKIVPKEYRLTGETSRPQSLGRFLTTELYPGSLIVLFGIPGIGKSTLLFQNAPHGTRILGNEYSVEVADQMFAKWAKTELFYIPVANVRDCVAFFQATNHRFYAIDTLQTMISDYDEGNLFVEWLNAHLKETGKCCIVVSHTNNNPNEKGINRIEGLLRLRQLCDVAIFVVGRGKYRKVKDRFEFLDELDNNEEKEYTLNDLTSLV